MFEDREIRPPEVIRREIKDLQAYLEGVPEDFRKTGALASYESRLDALHEELYLAEFASHVEKCTDPLLDLRLYDESGENFVPPILLGRLLEKWQRLYDAAGQAAQGSPTKRGTIPRAITKQTQLGVMATPPGSLVIRMALRAEQTGLTVHDSLGVKAYRILQKLGTIGDEPEELEEVYGRVKGRVVSHYSDILELLDTQGFDIEVNLGLPGETPSISQTCFQHQWAERVSHTFDELSDREENELVYIGILNGANLRTAKFELDLGDDDGTLNGDIAPELADEVDGAILGARYEATVREHLERDRITNETESSYRLVGLEKLD